MPKIPVQWRHWPYKSSKQSRMTHCLALWPVSALISVLRVQHCDLLQPKMCEPAHLVSKLNCFPQEQNYFTSVQLEKRQRCWGYSDKHRNTQTNKGWERGEKERQKERDIEVQSSNLCVRIIAHQEDILCGGTLNLSGQWKQNGCHHQQTKENTCMATYWWAAPCKTTPSVCNFVV